MSKYLNITTEEAIKITDRIVEKIKKDATPRKFIAIDYNEPTNIQEFTPWIDISNWRCFDPRVNEVKKVIFNNLATVVLWQDGTKTVVKAMEEDTFSKERGFLQAYFEKHSRLSKTQANKLLKKLVEGE